MDEKKKKNNKKETFNHNANGEIIPADSRLDSFVQQNSPINNEMIRNSMVNELYAKSIDGQLSMLPAEITVREGHGKVKEVYSLCAFSYDESVDLELINKNGRYKITAFDRRVYNAIGTLWLNNRFVVSLTEIFEVMNGYVRTNPSSTQLKSIERSLIKLRSIRLYIDMTAEVKANIIKDKEVLIRAGVLASKSDKIQNAVLEASMLDYAMGTITSEQGKVYRSIRIMCEPSLLTYNRAKGSLLSVPMEYIGLANSNTTEKTIAFQDYMLMRIIGYRNGRMRENKILYDTLYRDSGIIKPEIRKDFLRDRETVKRILDEWIDKGLISSYEEVKEGRTFSGVVFQIGGTEKIAEKTH